MDCCDDEARVSGCAGVASIYDMGLLYDEGLNDVAVGSSVLDGKGSLSAASMLDVVGVWLIWEGRSSGWGNDSWPAMGDRVKKACCTTGSTDAWTELVESATLRRTFRAIQSLIKDAWLDDARRVPRRDSLEEKF